MSTSGLRNIGPKSAAWLRQVGLHTQQDLIDTGAVVAFVKVRRAGFKPSLNLLYSLEAALLGCHWQELPVARRQQLVAEYEAIIAVQPLKRPGPASGPVYSTEVVAPGEGDEPAQDDTDLLD
ncbi:TfoX/Sxy family protein [Stenotrophomonas sp. Marseille-Q4652]|uniref:TfoX/Sxy family protein n=1 Tax=Stenotrophomonas sp. Marseille-Q4652 TaxID=2866595 RepID=UPI001CE432BA|nr:TfoX/Sxy family protein [Stenotrophomonas sp. Marseille-Q4652]